MVKGKCTKQNLRAGQVGILEKKFFVLSNLFEFTTFKVSLCVAMRGQVANINAVKQRHKQSD